MIVVDSSVKKTKPTGTILDVNPSCEMHESIWNELKRMAEREKISFDHAVSRTIYRYFNYEEP